MSESSKPRLKKLTVKDVQNLKGGAAKGGTCISDVPKGYNSRVFSDPGCSIGTCGSTITSA